MSPDTLDTPRPLQNSGQSTISQSVFDGAPQGWYLGQNLMKKEKTKGFAGGIVLQQCDLSDGGEFGSHYGKHG